MPANGLDRGFAGASERLGDPASCLSAACGRRGRPRCLLRPSPRLTQTMPMSFIERWQRKRSAAQAATPAPPTARGMAMKGTVFAAAATKPPIATTAAVLPTVVGDVISKPFGSLGFICFYRTRKYPCSHPNPPKEPQKLRPDLHHCDSCDSRGDKKVGYYHQPSFRERLYLLFRHGPGHPFFDCKENGEGLSVVQQVDSAAKCSF
jgi:hypothetical protein